MYRITRFFSRTLPQQREIQKALRFMKCPITNSQLFYHLPNQTEEDDFIYSIIDKEKMIKYPIPQDGYLDVTSLNAVIQDQNILKTQD